MSSSEPSVEVTTTPSNQQRMNGLSFSELCCLFCCPPCPARIAAKLAFLPPEPTYNLVPDSTNTKFSLSLTERAEWQYTQRELDSFEVFFSRTNRGNRIACELWSSHYHLMSNVCPMFVHRYVRPGDQHSEIYRTLQSRECRRFGANE